MKKKETTKGKEKKLSPEDAQEKDWEKVQQTAFEALVIAKCLWIALTHTTDTLDDTEIDTVVLQIRDGLDEIYKVATEHI